MEYVDKPQPSRAYLALVISSIVILGLIAMAFPFIKGVVFVTLFSVTVFPLVLLMIETLHAAYATEYRISDGTLHLRCGWLMNRRIPTQDIQVIQDAKFISRVLGWNPGVFGYCNRFTNGLLLRTSNYSVFVSPADVHAFRKALQCNAAPTP